MRNTTKLKKSIKGKDLIAMITNKAAERMIEAKLASDYDEDEKSERNNFV